ncbi:MAG: helix-turn-helix domain-containing protein [Pseudonocardiaceae bacterium]
MIDRQTIVAARHALGRQLAERRKAAGHSQHEFAPFTHYARSTIANAEVGRQLPPLGFWQRCDEALGADGTLVRGYEDLRALIRQQHDEAARALDERGEREHVQREVPCDPMRRRTVVTWGVATTAATGLGIASLGAVGAADVERLRRVEDRLYRLADRYGGVSLWQGAAAAADEGYLLLEQGSYGAGVGQQLLMVTGRLQVCAGSLAFDAGQHGIARACWTDALALARQASDPAVEIRALSHLAKVSYVLDRPREAQRLATAAEHVATSARSSRLAVLPQNRQAMASALMADARGANQAITQARKAMDRAHDEPVEEWCAFLRPFEIDGLEATCVLELGQAARAATLLEQAIAGYGSRFTRNCAIYRARLARARLDNGAVDGAAEAANTVLDDLSGELASWRVNSELDKVARRLADYPEVVGVDRFLAGYRAMRN